MVRQDDEWGQRDVLHELYEQVRGGEAGHQIIFHFQILREDNALKKSFFSLFIPKSLGVKVPPQ